MTIRTTIRDHPMTPTGTKPAKGYFLLRFLARRLGDDTYFSFLRKFVHTFHGQLILSQVINESL
ncbi:Aminopeptidase O [Myotis davidii]|uniref:Aminopeptidase O n=1 Tax=Myotis davidii TaxID=225400 RepID=L5MHS0_MYODS|nr:Aminopeptidase O [Myotis davidii]